LRGRVLAKDPNIRGGWEKKFGKIEGGGETSAKKNKTLGCSVVLDERRWNLFGPPSYQIILSVAAENPTVRYVVEKKWGVAVKCLWLIFRGS